MKWILFLLFFLFIVEIRCEEDIGLIPVSHQGRFRPLEVYSKLFLNDLYHAQEFEPQDLNESALSFFLKLYFQGGEELKNIPLFFISPELQKELKISKKRLSYQELHQYKSFEKEWGILLQKAKFLNNPPPLHVLPSAQPATWLNLMSLEKGKTLLRNEDRLKNALKEWKTNPTIEGGKDFAKLYFEAYEPLSGKSFPLSSFTYVKFPTLLQLKVEKLYYSWPLINFIIGGYLLAVLCFLLGEAFSTRFFNTLAWSIALSAFFLHTAVLLARVYILQRPPVSNMAETVIYVPWISVLVGFLFSIKLETKLLLITALSTAAILLTILEWTLGSGSLEQVQAVLNSQLWLSIHVLMIVGSYGILILAGILSHIYLIKNSPILSKTILKLLYLGVALLIPGTILGGVWAAQSWGRFWDWDPKESWAFISACIYLIVIHSYRFGLIGSKGLAMGAILGFLSISFTWYGVNYILGTGLHSYGFGSGGEWIYYSFIGCEGLFLALCTLFPWRNIDTA